MNDVQLKYVVKAVEAGSFAKVAEYYYTSYQAISYQIDSLESEFGVTIFKRLNKGCELTGLRLFFTVFFCCPYGFDQLDFQALLGTG